MTKTNHRNAAQRSWQPWLSVLAAAALVIAAGALWALAAANTPAAIAYPAEIGLADAVAKRSAGAFILDVRQPDEWADYHVPGSTLIPLEQLEARARELPRDREVVVMCRSGNRSATGRDILKRAGFNQVSSLAGGLSQWKAAGHPTASGP